VFSPAAVVSLVVLMIAIAGNWLPGLTTRFRGCWFYNLTGRPCPGCGLTRALLALGRGDFVAAWRFNPFVWPVLGLILLTICDGLIPWRNWVPLRWRSFLAAAFAVSWIGWGLWRMFHTGTP
jgi:hypothetical protein